MSKPALAIFFSALAALLIVAGCGDSSLSKAEFIEQGDVICRKGEAKKGAAIQAYFEKIDFAKSAMTLAEAEYETKNVLAPTILSQVDQLRELNAPDAEDEKVASMLTSAERAMKQMEADAETRRKRGKKPTKVGEFDDPFADTAKAFEDYGFKICFNNY